LVTECALGGPPAGLQSLWKGVMEQTCTCHPLSYEAQCRVQSWFPLPYLSKKIWFQGWAVH